MVYKVLCASSCGSSNLIRFTSYMGRSLDVFVGFIDRRHESWVLTFDDISWLSLRSGGYVWLFTHGTFAAACYAKVLVAISARCRLRASESRQLSLGLCFPRCLGRPTLKPFIVNGLEHRNKYRNIPPWWCFMGIHFGGNHERRFISHCTRMTFDCFIVYSWL